MRNYGQIMMVVVSAAAFGFAGCAGHALGNDRDSEVDAAVIPADSAIDAAVIADAKAPDAETQKDSGAVDANVQTDGSADAMMDAAVDAAIQNDGAAQNDASADGSIIIVDPNPATITYTVNSEYQGDATIIIWGGTNTVLLDLTLRNEVKASTLTSITFRLLGTAGGGGIHDATLVLDGTPIQQTATWTDPEHLTFETSLNLNVNEEVTLQLQANIWAVCETVAFNVEFDHHIAATTNDNQEPATIEESQNSITPDPTRVEGFYFESHATSQQGGTGPDRELLVISIMSSFDAIVDFSEFRLVVNPATSQPSFDNFKLWDYGVSIAGPVSSTGCNADECEINFSDRYYIPGDCWIHPTGSSMVTADVIGITEETIGYIYIPTANWVVTMEHYPFLQVPPEKIVPEILTGATFIFFQ